MSWKPQVKRSGSAVETLLYFHAISFSWIPGTLKRPSPLRGPICVRASSIKPAHGICRYVVPMWKVGILQGEFMIERSRAGLVPQTQGGGLTRGAKEVGSLTADDRQRPNAVKRIYRLFRLVNVCDNSTLGSHTPSQSTRALSGREILRVGFTFTLPSRLSDDPRAMSSRFTHQSVPSPRSLRTRNARDWALPT